MLIFSADLYAACGSKIIEWDGGNTGKWSDRKAWVGDKVPLIDQDTLIVSAAKNCRLDAPSEVTCFVNDSGVMTQDAGAHLTITGDHYRNLTLNSYSATAGEDCQILMSGLTPQSFENVDPINKLIISNDSTVTLTHSFEIRSELTLSGTSTYLIINANSSPDYMKEDTHFKFLEALSIITGLVESIVKVNDLEILLPTVSFAIISMI